MSDTTSIFNDFLRDMAPMVKDAYKPGVLFEMLEREAAERKRKDDAYLATLTPAELRRVLVDRRIRALEYRLGVVSRDVGGTK